MFPDGCNVLEANYARASRLKGVLGWTETQLGAQTRPNILILCSTWRNTNNESEYYFNVQNVNRIIDNKSIPYQIISYKLVPCVHYFLVFIDSFIIVIGCAMPF